MTRSSPSADRVIAILNLLAAHPGQPFILSDFVQMLGLSRATCHALLTSLVEAGYLYRTRDKHYIMGRGLAALGRAAIRHYAPMEVARPEMRDLAETFDAICSVLLLVGDCYVVRMQTPAQSRMSWTVHDGMRRPVWPMFGSVFLLGAPPDDIEDWLVHFEDGPAPEHKRALLEGLEFVRRHGFCFGVRDRTAPLLLDPAEPDFKGRERFATIIPSAIEADRSYELVQVSAPVIGPDRRVAFVLCLSAFAFPVKGETVAKIGRRLHEASQRIGAYIDESAHDALLPPRETPALASA